MPRKKRKGRRGHQTGGRKPAKVKKVRKTTKRPASARKRPASARKRPASARKRPAKTKRATRTSRRLPPRRTPETGQRRITSGEKQFKRLVEKVPSPKKLQFGKRVRVKGRYYQTVVDRSGREIARVPWNSRIKRQVRVAVEIAKGRTTKKTRREAGLDLPGWKNVPGAYDVADRTSVWTKSVWKGGAVPVGTPGYKQPGRYQKYDADRGWHTGDVHKPRARSFGFFGAAYGAIDPNGFIGTLDALPDSLLKRETPIGLVFVLEDGDGNRIRHVYLQARLESYIVGSKKLFIDTLFAEGLRDVAHEYGYAGEVGIVGVELMIGGAL